jgi:nucleoside-diphosphate-sugar epimerase
MRIVVTGATGNVGTSLLAALEGEGSVDEVLGLARRAPGPELQRRLPKASWTTADVTRDDLAPWFRGADAVVHLAWLLQPSHDEARTWRTNVEGSERVLRAVADAGVGALLHASSVGAYSAGPKAQAVDESWPTHGIPTSSYSRDKAYVERLLDVFERDHPAIRVVRMRPALTFKREAAAELRRTFAGPLLPGALVRPSAIPVVPTASGLRLQAVHSDDVADAYRLAAVSDARGPFNLAADPTLDAEVLARLLDARTVQVPGGLLRGAAGLSWALRLQPTSAGWVDLALQMPLMATTRARTELGWRPRHSADDALAELLDGMRGEAGAPSPPLSPSGILDRARELLGGAGARDPGER